MRTVTNCSTRLPNDINLNLACHVLTMREKLADDTKEARLTNHQAVGTHDDTL